MEVSGESQIFVESLLLRAAKEQEEEVLRHKWLESEKAGRDVGYDFARIDWSLRHRRGWLSRRHLSPEEHRHAVVE